jgi:hypothetical protein
MPAAIPYQIVPPSILVKVNTSTPAELSVGAVAAAQSIEVGHVRVALPPFVMIIVKLQAVPLAAGLVNVIVCAPLSV